MNTFRVCSYSDLTAEQRAAWAAIQEATPSLDSPYFRPEFTAAVAAVRSDVRVAVIEQAGQAVGFLPFQNKAMGAGKPVGSRMSDYQGLIAKPDLRITSSELLRGCGLHSYAFDHLPAAQATFTAAHAETALSRHFDLSGGFEAYLADRKAAKSGEVKEAQQKFRKMERDLGPVRVEFDCRDRDVFDTLLAWKSEQYERTGFTDIFAFGWPVKLLNTIWEQRDPAFCGLLSSLYAGDTLLAMHFGMRSHGVLHSWFPAYSMEHSKLSPGGVLLLEVAREAAAAGITKIDLGKGDEKYKQGFTNGSTLLAEGRVSRGGVLDRANASWGCLRSWLRTARVAAPVRASARALRPLRDRWAFE